MPLIITPSQQEEIIKHPRTVKRICQTKKILVWETYEDTDEVFIWHPFRAEMMAVKQSDTHVPGMDFSGIVSVPNIVYNSGKTIWSSGRNYDMNIMNINNFSGILSGIYEEFCNEKDGDTFINHYTHFCHTIGYAITENLIKKLKVVEEITYFEEPVFILRNDFVYKILKIGEESMDSYSMFTLLEDGYFDGEIKNLKMFEVNEFT